MAISGIILPGQNAAMEEVATACCGAAKMQMSAVLGKNVEVVMLVGDPVSGEAVTHATVAPGITIKILEATLAALKKQQGYALFL